MATTLEIVRAYYPGQDSVPDATVNLFIEEAAKEIGTASSTWGIFYQRAVAALAAHSLELRARSNGAGGAGGGSGVSVMGVATSVKTGDESLSVSDGASLVAGGFGAGSDKIYTLTVGGMDYLRLRERVPEFGIAVTQ